MFKIDTKKLVVYDIETIQNLITFCFISVETNNKKQFVLFDHPTYGVQQLKSLLDFLLFLRKNGYTLIGFNCLNFDAQILELIITYFDDWMMDLECGTLSFSQIISKIYDRAQELIKMPDEDKFKKLVPEWKLNIPHIDLFKQKHYDGKAKQGTSLKWIEFTINFNNVEEMPIEHNQWVKLEEIKQVLSYNWNDVYATLAFFNTAGSDGKGIRFETDLRIQLSEKYQMNLINASEPKIAKMIFAKFLCEEMKIGYQELRELKSFRQEVDLEEIIFPYIRFQDKELQDVLYIIKNTTTFPFGNEEGKLFTFKDSNIKLVKNKKKGKGNSKKQEKFEHFFKYADVPTDVGLGGIHACCESGKYSSTDNWVIHDIDVTSFYPNLAIKNNVKPEQLGESFSLIYERLFEERKLIPKKDPINYVYKIILNSTYGLSKEINSYLYDPKFTYAITINGQLSILMLVEMLKNRIPGIKFYQENTDGVTVGYEIKNSNEVSNVCEEWCKITKLQLEHNKYKEIIIVDVNNYIALDLNNKVKKKGLFETELDFHKNPSFLIIPKALEAYYIKGINYVDFISNKSKEDNSFFDFMAAVKKKKDFDLKLKKIENHNNENDEKNNGSVLNYYIQQKVTRFYAAIKGGRLIKKYKSGKLAGRTSIVLRDSEVEIVNKLEENFEIHKRNINTRFYVKEVEKVVSKISPKSKNQLGLFG